MIKRIQLKRIKDAEAALASAETAYEYAREELEQAKQDACPVKVGDTVISEWRHTTGEECRIVSIDFSSDEIEHPWLRAVRRKKDGEWSTQAISLFGHWRLP